MIGNIFYILFIGFIKKLSSELLFTIVSVFSNMAATDLVLDISSIYCESSKIRIKTSDHWNFLQFQLILDRCRGCYLLA